MGSAEILVSDELERFLFGESICAKCEVLKYLQTLAARRAPPIHRHHFNDRNFFKRWASSMPKMLRRLQKLLATIRNDDMRNGLSHGRKSSIPSAVVDKAMASFQELRSVFLSTDTSERQLIVDRRVGMVGLNDCNRGVLEFRRHLVNTRPHPKTACENLLPCNQALTTSHS